MGTTVNKKEVELEKDLMQVAVQLRRHLKRMPTEQELYDFVFGSKEDQDRVWDLSSHK